MAFDRPSYMRVWAPEHRRQNLESYREYDNQRHAKEKNAAFVVLGSVCLECKEHEPEFLTLEHLRGGGYRHRKEQGRRSIYSDISRGRVDVSEYAVLCRNCNSGKAITRERLSALTSTHPLTGGICSRCGSMKTRRESSHPKYGTRVRSDCLSCLKVSNIAVKVAAFARLGGRCRCCLVDDFDKLTVDHVHNDGSKWRKENGNNHVTVYRRISKDLYPEGMFQLLCWNCNFSKHLGRGLCVHERKGS